MAADALFQPEQNIDEISNPLYRQIKIKIDLTEKELARANSERKSMQEEVREYHERVARTHEVQRSYDDMTRDYESTKRKYQELRAKQLEADVAQNLESENKAESFTLIEPPLKPTESVKPNRPKLLMMGLFLSGAVSLGLVLLVEMLDPAVRSTKDIAELPEENPGYYPVDAHRRGLQQEGQIRKRMIIVAILLTLVMLAIVHYFVMSLDIVWFKVMAKINML